MGVLAILLLEVSQKVTKKNKNKHTDKTNGGSCKFGLGSEPKSDQNAIGCKTASGYEAKAA
jgi:hypothetical protein